MTSPAFPEAAALGLFDCNCGLGPWRAPQPAAPESAADLLRVMDRAGIAEALVYSTVARAYDPAQGNQALLQEIASHPRLHPCWVLVPPHAGELPGGRELVRQMLAAGVRAARVFPEEHHFFLAPWCFGQTLEALAEARIPLFVDWGKTHWSQALAGWPAIHELCENYPGLPVIPVREGAALERFLGPLLSRHPGLRLETSYYVGHQALGRHDSARLLFGTGMPWFDPALAVGSLICSGLPEASMRAVAGDNLRRLLAEVRPI